MTNGQNLRVIAGALKGRVLLSPGSSKTHPMGAREKLSLFNMLTPWRIEGVKVLDAYAGSGALAIEALSRGASEAVLVEKDRRASQIIKENLVKVRCTERARVYTETMQKFSQRPEYQEYFDLIFMDPPYDKFDEQEVQDEVIKLLASGGILALSYPKARSIEFDGMELISQHNYAAAGIALYRKK